LIDIKLKMVRGVLIDLSGTVHVGRQLIPGTIEAIQKLSSSGIPVSLYILYIHVDVIDLNSFFFVVIQLKNLQNNFIND
jgi:hypothetical protein